MDGCYHRNITPLAAKVVGSRMMGVSHDGSDYDVHLIYKQPAWVYAGGSENTGTYEWMTDDGEIDVAAYNINKFSSMLMQTNPTAVEILLSDESAMKDRTGYLDELRGMIHEYGNRMALHNHYISLARNNYRQYIDNGNDNSIARNFFVLRATLLAKHIRKTNELPPMRVDDFLAKSEAISQEERNTLSQLATKKKIGEGGEYWEDVSGQFFEEEGSIELEPTDERTKQPRREVLDEFIKIAITEV